MSAGYRSEIDNAKTLDALIDLHIADMTEIGKPLGRTKAYSLERIKDRQGQIGRRITASAPMASIIALIQ